MDLAQFREYCLSKPRATEGTPFGPDFLVFKVRGKMFALAALEEVPTTVNLKCDPDLALELRQALRHQLVGMVDHLTHFRVWYSALNLHSVPVFLVHVIARLNLLITVAKFER